ncbi:DUF4258 domain-containing protein [Eisenbergiella tayi]|nr:DUF4258 domain-containing protein [Eisenbergiella tayi]
MHAARRLEQRGISINDIIHCIIHGEIIEQYPTDYPYPSCLILGISVNDKLIHTVIGSNQSQLWIITAYYPDINKWSEDFRVRKED